MTDILKLKRVTSERNNLRKKINSERWIHKRVEYKLNTEIEYWKTRSSRKEKTSLASVTLEKIGNDLEFKLKDLNLIIAQLENELKAIWARIDRIPFELKKCSKRPTSK